MADESNRGEMAALVRAMDWSKTPLGPASSWSQALRTVVGLLLSSRFPLLLWWGPSFIQIYNDAYAPILGAKHPARALGKPVSECWDEIIDVIGPLLKTPFRGGPATWSDDLPSPPEAPRLHGGDAPLHNGVQPGARRVGSLGHRRSPGDGGRDDRGGLRRRQLTTLGDLARQASDARSAADACDRAARVLERNPRDVPFALFFYLRNGDGCGWWASAGFRRRAAGSAAELRLDDDGAWPVGRVGSSAARSR